MSTTNPRAWARELLSTTPSARYTFACGDCGCVVSSDLPLQEQADLLANAGWTIGAQGKLRCARCTAGPALVRVRSSSVEGRVYRVAENGSSCTCPGFAWRRRCSHSSARKAG